MFSHLIKHIVFPKGNSIKTKPVFQSPNFILLKIISHNVFCYTQFSHIHPIFLICPILFFLLLFQKETHISKMKTKKQRRPRKQKFHTKKKSTYHHGASFVLPNTPVYGMSKECFWYTQ